MINILGVEEFKKFCDGLTDGVLFSEIESDNILYCNVNMEHYIGYNKEKILDMNWMDLFTAIKLENYVENLIEYDDFSIPFTQTVQYTNRKDLQMEIDVIVFPVDTDAGECLVTIFRSTETEYSYERLLNTLHSTNKALNYLIDSKRSSLEEVTNNVCKMLIDNPNEDMAWIGILDFDDLEKIQPVADAGPVDNIFDGMDELDISHSDISTVIEYGEALIIKDIHDEEMDSIWTIIAKEFNLKSIILLPLKVDDLTFGILSLFSKETFAYGINTIKQYQFFIDRLSKTIVSYISQDESQDISKVKDQIDLAIHDLNNLFTSLISKHTVLKKKHEDPMFDELNSKIYAFSDHIESLYDGRYTKFNEGSSTSPQERKNEPSEDKYNILVVDDDQGSRELLRSILQSEKYHILVANDGEEALEKLDKFANKISLVVLDILMPGKSGLEVAEEIRGKSVDIPIIFVSGFQITPFVEGRLQTFGSPFLSKPFKPEKLLELVNDKIIQDQ